MALEISPQVTFSETDFSATARALGLTRFLVVGGAEKGPLNTPIEINSEDGFLRTFGQPLTTDYGAQSAIQFLRKGNRLVYLRVAGNSVETATAKITGLTGGSVKTKATGSVTLLNSNPVDGDTITLNDGDVTNTFEFDDDNSVGAANIAVLIGADRDETIGNFVAVVNDNSSVNIDADVDSAASDPTADLTQRVAGSARNVTITESFSTGANVTVSGFTGGDDPSPSTGAITLSSQPTDQDTITIDDGSNSQVFEFDDNNSQNTAGSILVAIGSDVQETGTNLEAAINNSTLAVTANRDPDLNSEIVDILHDSDGANNTTIQTSGGGLSASGLSGGAAGTSPSQTAQVMTLAAATPGAWGNNLQTEILDTSVRNAPAGRFDLLIRAPQSPKSSVLEVVERYNNLSLDPSSDRFVTDVIAGNVASQASASDFITVSSVKVGSQVSTGTYNFGKAGGRAGNNGIQHDSSSNKDGLLDANGNFVTSAYIGSVSGQTATGMKAARNEDLVKFNLAAVPGVPHRDVINELIDLAESRSAVAALIDPPMGLDVDQVRDWHNGTASGIGGIPAAPNQQLNTSFAALYWPWVEVFDNYNDQKIFLPPSGFVGANAAATDRDKGPWFPIAGHNRGVIENALSVEVSPDARERALLLREGNAVNPIVNFSETGITIFGNDTLHRTSGSILQQFHVRRMLVYAKTLINDSVKFLIFDPNDPVTRRRFVKLVEPILEGIRAQRGLQDFRVIADASINTPDVVRERKLIGKILLKPLNAVEVIEVPFALFAQGADFGEELSERS